MLTKDPAHRISIAAILTDPWFDTPSDGSDEVAFGSGHVNRLPGLFELHRKMKFIFESRQVEKDVNTVRKASTADICVPASFASSSCSATAGALCHSTGTMVNSGESHESLERKLQVLKGLLVDLVSARSDEIANSPPQSKRRRKLIHDGSIDYDKYNELMTDSGLGDMYGNEQSFRLLFDRDNSGTVDLKEFLVTILALSPATSEDDQIDAAALYFKLFDINKDGHIDSTELELVVNCLLNDGTGALLLTDASLDLDNIEQLFDYIDTSGDGKISLQEFTTFYQQLLSSSSLALNQSVFIGSAASTN